MSELHHDYGYFTVTKGKGIIHFLDKKIDKHMLVYFI